MQVRYEVWAVGKSREWPKYEGPSEAEALAAKAKAEGTGKWEAVKMETRMERTGAELEEWVRNWRG